MSEPLSKIVEPGWADALAPVKRYSYTEKYLHDPAFPEEDFNAVWRDAMNYAVPDEISPFVNGQAVQRILNKQLDLVKSNQKSAADALRTAARQINEEIQKTIQRDPELRRRYEALVNGKEKERPSFAASGRSPQAVTSGLDGNKSIR